MTPRYAILTCPVCWENVDYNENTLTYQVDEYLLTFCSDECIKKFNEDQEYYTKLILSSINHSCCCGGNCSCNE
ncbi:MAG: hypothetical protein N2504_00555 [candidate division WOR-3 bacterium]|nr:hypothetical protein [candidate division WOR-3 bacterium]MCX7947064.1 hypothetical protein [candidate division WOR-3 bacterium]MDW8149895.1 hypothetical protein [candidate division WOR-3 bacterium]